jgi:hypothetical protein
MKNRRRREGQDNLDLDNIEGTDEYQRQLEDARRASPDGGEPVLAEGEKVGPWTEEDEQEEDDAPALAGAAADPGEEDEGYQARPRTPSAK